MDGNFECKIYFKEIKLATEVIIEKYSENNDDGLIKIEQPETSQTPELTEYRYSGSNEEVKNYVKFNDELWRIIGVFEVDDGTGNYEQRVKIVRDESVGDGYPWDTSAAGINDYTNSAGTREGAGVNQWGESGSYEGADLMRLLNPGFESDSINNSLYYNSGSGTCYAGSNNETKECDFSNVGLNEKAKSMISNAKWYLGAVNHFGVKVLDAYIQERGNVTGSTDVGINVIKTVNWVGKVALPYISDYGYASSECYESVILLENYEAYTSGYGQEKCKNSNWLFNGNYQDLLNPSSNERNGVRRVFSEGVVGNGLCSNMFEDTRPTLYLSSSVKMTSGKGTSFDPYILSL